jgi:hypothetical protein
MDNNFGNEETKHDGIGTDAPKCPGCGSPINKTDDFCGECGTKIRQDISTTGAQKLWSEEVDASVKKATKWVLAVAIMFIVFGTIMGLMQKSTTDKALANLVKYDDSLTWSQPINGKTVTVGQLKKMVNFEYYSVFAVNYFLSIVMFVIFVWSKKSPFSAFVTALSIYLGVMVLSAIVDPKTIIQGVIVKVAVIMALINGIKAAIPTKGLARGSA